MKLPAEFFKHYGHLLGDLELDRDINPDWVSALEFDLATIHRDVARMRSLAEREGERDELLAMLEFVAAATDNDTPFDLSGGGLWFSAVLLEESEMNYLAAWARSVNFPELAPMTDAEKRAAVKRVEITKTPLDEWRKQRRAERE